LDSDSLIATSVLVENVTFALSATNSCEIEHLT